MSYRWSHSSQPSYPASSHPSTSPGAMPSAPHLHTVSLPHPNSASHHPSTSQYSHYDQGSSGIRALNPLLSASGTGMLPIYYNVTKDLQYIQLQPGCPQNSLDAHAVHPSSQRLVLNILRSAVEVRNPGGVTVRDVLIRIRDALHRGVSPTEMSSVGMRRVDLLGQNVLFAGLSRPMDGRDHWEVHFVRPRT